MTVKTTIVDEGLQDGPGGTEHRLLVADEDVPPGEEVEELPVRPDLAEVAARTTRAEA